MMMMMNIIMMMKNRILREKLSFRMMMMMMLMMIMMMKNRISGGKLSFRRLSQGHACDLLAGSQVEAGEPRQVCKCQGGGVADLAASQGQVCHAGQPPEHLRRCP